MAGNKAALIALAFAGSIGMTLVILACALPQYKLWWPFFVVAFYVLTVFPSLVAKRRMQDFNAGSSCLDFSIFLTIGIMISCFALPIVLARSDVIQWGSCYLTLAGNFVVYLTMIAYFSFVDQDETYGGMH